MTKEQTAYLISLEERNKALAEEVQALEFEMKDKDKHIRSLNEDKAAIMNEVRKLEGELELCEKTHAHVHDENQLNIKRAKMLEAELQQYEDPVVDRTGKIPEVYSAVSNFMMQDKECYANKTYRVLVVVLEAKDV